MKGKSMSNLTIVANIIAENDHVELVRLELTKLIEPTRKEEGCIQYDLHQDNQNPAHFVFFEKWTSKQHLEAHLKNNHIAQYAQAVEGAIAQFTLNEMTHIA